MPIDSITVFVDDEKGELTKELLEVIEKDAEEYPQWTRDPSQLTLQELALTKTVDMTLVGGKTVYQA